MNDAATPVTVTEAERRTVALGAFVGTALEWCDFFLYGTAASLVVNRLFFASQDAVVALAGAFASFAVGFAARPLGAVIFGRLGDRIGRRRCLIAGLLAVSGGRSWSPAVLLIAIALVTAGCAALAPRMSLAQDRVVAQ